MRKVIAFIDNAREQNLGVLGHFLLLVSFCNIQHLCSDRDMVLADVGTFPRRPSLLSTTGAAPARAWLDLAALSPCLHNVTGECTILCNSVSLDHFPLPARTNINELSALMQDTQINKARIKRDLHSRGKQWSLVEWCHLLRSFATDLVRTCCF